MHDDDPLLIAILQRLQQLQQTQQSLSEQLTQFKQAHEAALKGVHEQLGRLRSMQLEAGMGNYTLQVGPLPPPATPPRPPVTLAILATGCDQGPYLKEWIEYHKLVGVQRFYFYDTSSEDNTREVLDTYIQDGTLIYHRVDGYSVGGFARADGLWRYKFEAKWLASIDVDEFMVPVQHDNLLDFLSDFEAEHMQLNKGGYCGIAMNWLGFDSNGHETKPTAHGGLVTANYTRVRRDHDRIVSHDNDRIIKNILNPRAILSLRDHNVVATMRTPLVTENHEPVWGSMTARHFASKIQLNHYRTKSREEFVIKTNRNTRWHGKSKIVGFDERMLNFPGPTEHNLTIQRFVPALKKALGIADE